MSLFETLGSMDSITIGLWVTGLMLVLVVLALFLDIRSAFWVGLSIPVVLLGIVFLLPLFGAYLDVITLTAMILVIGIIVDDGVPF